MKIKKVNSDAIKLYETNMVKLKLLEIPEKSSLWLEIIINNAFDINKQILSKCGC